MPRKNYRSITIEQKFFEKLEYWWLKTRNYDEQFSPFVVRMLLENSEEKKKLRKFAGKIEKVQESSIEH